MLQTILRSYGLDDHVYQIEPLGSGLINKTWKVFAPHRQTFVLQQINTNVFKDPEYIASNIEKIGMYLDSTDPSYLFAAPLQTRTGRYLVYFNDGCYRLSPFIPGSHTVDALAEHEQAYEAARQFGRFSRMLQNFDADQLEYTLPDFHNLGLRINQFQNALKEAERERLKNAASQIEEVCSLMSIADTYNNIIAGKTIPVRVIHHDTKISNVLFDENGKGLCVIDLDTVMPGYFISDVGDMMRTYLSESNEEEKNIDSIAIRPQFFAAIHAGYMEEMGTILTRAEKELFIYSGKFMIYMQAVRFLTDYLNGDVYYSTHYECQNLVRAKNQLKLLQRYIESEVSLKALTSSFENI